MSEEQMRAIYESPLYQSYFIDYVNSSEEVDDLMEEIERELEKERYKGKNN
jgi:hypothetical protein